MGGKLRTYASGKQYGAYIIDEEVEPVYHNRKWQPAFKVHCSVCGTVYLKKARDQLSDSDRRGYIHCSKCKDLHRISTTDKAGKKTTIPGEVPWMGKFFIYGQVS